MLTRAGAIALRALVELARDPDACLALPELARRQGLPEAMLEQILQGLRRDGLVRSRRGRRGGYQLTQPPQRISLERILGAVGGLRQIGRSPTAALALPQACAGLRVEEQLRARLALLVQRELRRLTLAELLYDQQSWEASLGPEGGVML